jgi:hypothetical protein
VSRLLLSRRLRRDLAGINETQRHLLTEVVLAISIRIALLCFIPSIIAIGFTYYEARERSMTNRALIEETNDLREQRLEDAAVSDHLLCQRINVERDILSDLIRGVIAAEASETRQQRAEFFADSLDRLQPKNCRTLPSQRPFDDPTEEPDG